MSNEQLDIIENVSLVKNEEITDKDVETLVKARIRFIETALPIAISQTNEKDWIMHDSTKGILYVQASGAAKINRVFRISVSVDEVEEKTMMFKGEEKTFYLVIGRATMPALTAPDGRIISPEYTIRCKATYDPQDENPYMRNVTHLWKKCESQLLRDAIVKIVGLENYTHEDLSNVMKKTGKSSNVSNVDYTKGAKGGKEEETAETKALRAIVGNALKAVEKSGIEGDIKAEDILEKLTSFTTSDGKEVKGKRSMKDVSVKQLGFLWGKVKESWNDLLESEGLL